MNRRLGALIAAALLTGVLAGPATAAKPALNVSVARVSDSCTFTVSVSWDRPKRGQGVLVVYLYDTYNMERPWVWIPVSPTETRGTATFVTSSNTDGYSYSFYGKAYLMRDDDGTRFSYDVLLEGSSSTLPPSADCVPVPMTQG